MPLNEEGFIDRVSLRHSVSPDAVRTIMRALRLGGGTMAQFSHAEFGGMSQWSPGMTMVGDMFNNKLKAKLDAVCTEWPPTLLKGPRRKADAGRARLAIAERRGRIGGLQIWGRQAQLAHKMNFGMLCFRDAS